MHRFIGILLLLAVSTVAFAADNTEIRRLQELLSVLNQQQQSVYQQFQMLQELRRSNSENSYTQPHTLQYLSGFLNYDDVVAAHNHAARREDEMRSRQGELYERFNEIEAAKKGVLDRLYELTVTPNQ
jgi:hypothetical protein